MAFYSHENGYEAGDDNSDNGDDDNGDDDNGDDDNGDDENGDDDNGNGAAYCDQTWRRPSYDPGTYGCTVAQHCVCS